MTIAFEERESEKLLNHSYINLFLWKIMLNYIYAHRVFQFFFPNYGYTLECFVELKK